MDKGVKGLTNGCPVGWSCRKNLEPLFNQGLCFLPEGLAVRAPKDGDDDRLVSPLSGADEAMAGCLGVPGFSSDEVLVGPEQLVGVLEKKGPPFLRPE